MTEAKIHLEFLLEGESDEIVLGALLPKIPAEITYAFHVFQSKQNLLKKLPERLRGYHSWLPPDWKIVILRDTDLEDCKKLKEHIRDIVAQEDFSIFSNTNVTKKGIVIIRLAMQEMEAWFFGDAEALRQAYPRLPETLDKRRNIATLTPSLLPGKNWKESCRRLVTIPAAKTRWPGRLPPFWNRPGIAPGVFSSSGRP